MTEQENVLLARFAGGTPLFYKKAQIYWEFPDGSKIDVARWNPADNREQWAMVLEALAKKQPIQIHGDDTGWYIVGHKRKWGQTLGQISCQATLAYIKGKAKP